MSIRFKLAIPFLAITAVALLLISELNSVKARQVLEAQITLDLNTQGNTSERHIAAVLREKRSIARNFASDGFVRDEMERLAKFAVEDSDEREALSAHLLANKLPLDPTIIGLQLMDLRGAVVAATGVSPPPGLNPLKLVRRGVALTHQPASEQFQDVVVVAAPVTSREGGRLLGALVNIHETRRLSTLFLDTARVDLSSSAQSATAYLMNENGAPIAGSAREIPLADLEALGSDFSRQQLLDGATALVAVRSIPLRTGEQWKLVLIQDETRVLAPIFRLRRAMQFGAIFVLVVLGIVVVVVTSVLTRPIRDLVAGAEIIGQGDLDHRINNKGRDEIGNLAQTIDKMAAALGASFKESQQLNADLEVRVKSRTAELQISNEELERSNRELGQFAYVASHDLKEPLRVISSYCDLLALRYGDKFDEKGERYLKHVASAALRMRRLITDLLAFSRIGSGGEELKPVELDGILDEALNNLQITIRKMRADIVGGEPLPKVLGDKGLLVQLLQNLIGNALKFCKTTPRIEVTARRFPTDESRWEIKVSDNGTGIAPEFQKQIFSIFKRLDANREVEGTGIGLAVCQRIVERHGGEIRVESEVGEGASFFFTLAGIP
ncbi:MAG: signal transduction histidine kinase [Verrucomicrobiales bacterium]|jgi:signal transduction histidine kinase